MKDILLKLTGKTVKSRGVLDDVQLVTEGKLRLQGGAILLSYEESEISGMEGCTTNVTIEKDRVSVRRSGDAVSQDSVMTFTKGRRQHALYETPYGMFPMELNTYDIKGPTLQEDGSHVVRIDYDISIRGLADARKVLDIEYRDKNG